MKIKEYLLKTNLYSIFLKLLGIGFIIIGILIIILIKKCNIFITALGMSFGILFLAFGEIINLLQKICDKNKEI
jgi:hypothetical protein